jgi:hypothetical protein
VRHGSTRLLRERADNARADASPSTLPAALPPVWAERAGAQADPAQPPVERHQVHAARAARITAAGVARLTADGGDRQFRVRDTGIGMRARRHPERALDAVRPGRQLRSPRKYHSGAGLGLPLSRAPWSSCIGGTPRRWQSEPGVGTTVTIGLPPDRIAA